ncbi:ABC transporter substrate-binding protein [Verrucomicrobiota bacterium]
MKYIWSILLMLICGCAKQSNRPIVPEHPQRVISLAPSITETVFTIGAEEKLVGNTDWCNYPEAAKGIARIGGYMTLNAEAALTVRPDTILLLAEHAHLRAKAEELDIPAVMLSNKTVSDILATITKLGVLLEREAEAESLCSEIKTRMRAISRKTETLKKPRVLITVGRNMGNQSIDSVYCVGLPPFHNELIEMAGGENACQLNQPYPRIGAEGILAMNPDIIIDLLDEQATPDDIEHARQDWLQNKQIRAVQNNQIHVLAGNHTVTPGPRFILLLEQFAQIIRGQTTH